MSLKPLFAFILASIVFVGAAYLSSKFFPYSEGSRPAIEAATMDANGGKPLPKMTVVGSGIKLPE